jgi:hypothetical protein
MSAVTGILLFTLAVFLFGVALVVARKSNPPRWLTEGSAGTLITITTIAFAVTGLGLVAQFAVSYGREPLGATEIILISISLIFLILVFTGIVKALGRSDTTAVTATSGTKDVAPALAEAAATASTKDEEGLSTPFKHDPSHSGQRKRVASKRAA